MGTLSPRGSSRSDRAGVVVLGVGLLVILGGAIVLAVMMSTSTDSGDPAWSTATSLLFFGGIAVAIGSVTAAGWIVRASARPLRRLGGRAADAAGDLRDPRSRARGTVALIGLILIGANIVLYSVGSTRPDGANGAPAGTIVVSLYAEGEGRLVSAAEGVDLVDHAIPVELEATVGGTSESPGDDAGSDVADLIPRAVIPAAGRCPSDPSSSDYRAGWTDSVAWDQFHSGDDPRCLERRDATWRNALAIGDRDVLAALIGRTPSAAAIDALENGGAVALSDTYESDDSVIIGWWPPGEEFVTEDGGDAPPPVEPAVSRSLDAVVEDTGDETRWGVLISPKTADDLDIVYEDVAIVVRPTGAPSTDDLILDVPLRDYEVSSSFSETGPVPAAVHVATLILAGLVLLGLSLLVRRRVRLTSDVQLDGGTEPVPHPSRAEDLWRSVALLLLPAVFAALSTLAMAIAVDFWQAIVPLGDPRAPFAPPWVALAVLTIGLPLLVSALTAFAPRRWATSPA